MPRSKPFPATVQISPTLKAVPYDRPFEREELWWRLYVLAPSGNWVGVQAGPKDSSLWMDLGVRLPE